jgi:hypothetical protein
MHYTTFVLLETAPPAPVLVFGPEDASEIPDLPLVTSLHVMVNEATPMMRASPLGFPVPVSDYWVDAVKGYGNEAKIVLLLEPVPGDIDTSYAQPEVGVHDADLPAWLPMMIGGGLKLAMRDVPVTSGTGLADWGIVLDRVANLDSWAQMKIGFD